VYSPIKLEVAMKTEKLSCLNRALGRANICYVIRNCSLSTVPETRLLHISTEIWMKKRTLRQCVVAFLINSEDITLTINYALLKMQKH
jgi:hypothetical protein